MKIIKLVVVLCFCSSAALTETNIEQRTGSRKVPSSRRPAGSGFSLSKEEIKTKIDAASSAEYKGRATVEDIFLNRDQYLGKVVELKFYAEFVSTTVGENPYLHIGGKEIGSSNDRILLFGQAALEWGVERDKKTDIFNRVSSTVYALVDEKSLIALGTNMQKVDNGYVYSFRGGAPSTGETPSDIPTSGLNPATDLSRLSAEELEKKVAGASTAEYKGIVTTEDLILKRDQYLGKVVELNFRYGSLTTSQRSNPRLSVSGGRGSSGIHHLYLCGQEALKWAAAVVKKSYGSSSRVYALVEEKGLLALGDHQRNVDDAYVYSW